MIQGFVLLLPAPERGVGLGIVEGVVVVVIDRGLPIPWRWKPTERVPPLSELFVDALIECFLTWSAAGAVAVLNPWALLGVAEALF